ncbi:MAG TPA: hypothetical protein VHQ01_10050, partial [Pyrinomonadaceae bacterium]|nr:hypothetical protein [Pyrinomonadaceae bacterium]
MKELLVISENHRDALKNCRWKWYCGIKMDRALKKLDALLEDGWSETPDQALRKVKFPKFISREELVHQIENRIESFNAARIPTDEEIYTQLVEAEDNADPAEDEMRDELKNEKERIDSIILKTRRH